MRKTKGKSERRSEVVNNKTVDRREGLAHAHTREFSWR
jgi:hypothetical protein